MWQYTVQRVLLAIPTLVGISLISFFIMRLAPGDPVDLFLGGAAGGEGISTDKQADREQTRQELRRQLGLDQSLPRQYLSWLSKLVLRVEEVGEGEYQGTGLELFRLGQHRFVTLDFGRSFKDQQPVIGHILKRLPLTLEINFLSLIFAYLVGVPLGVLLAVRQNTWIDRVLTSGSFVLWSMPSFWVGMLLILFLCNQEFLYWFPASGIQSLEASEDWGMWRLFTDHLHHLALPVLASTYASFAGLSRYMRTSMLENLRLDYVRTARAKGLPERVVVLRHVLRNSLIPIVTLMAGLLPGLIAGSVFIETIFTLPGMGFLGFQSLLVRDYPMVMAIFTIGAALSLLGILVADVLLKAVDPRIEFSRVQR
ncbi:MAG: ABC transporter permease [Candidatus Handelsmanbacteria bacterium]|nr:ABC transporter permease [Candidatus Handelsmanbacteria bacterium]